VTVLTIHKYDEKHLAEVMEVAKQIGKVEINAYYDGEVAYCLEGVHRVEAAKRLGIPLILRQRDWDEIVPTDCQDVEGYYTGYAKVSDIFECVYEWKPGRPHEGGVYSEDDFEGGVILD